MSRPRVSYEISFGKKRNENMDTEAKKLLGKPKHKINKKSYVHNEAKIGYILQTNLSTFFLLIKKSALLSENCVTFCQILNICVLKPIAVFASYFLSEILSDTLYQELFSIFNLRNIVFRLTILNLK